MGSLIDFFSSGHLLVVYRVDIYYRVLYFHAVVHVFTNVSFP